MRVALLVPIGFALGAFACRVALAFAPPDIRIDLAQPLVVVTYWQSFGAVMWACLLGAAAIGTVGYVFVLRNASTTSQGDKVSYVTFVSALACACALAFPVVFSSDVYAYAGYGDMAMHGIDAYAHARVTLRDPLLDAMLWQWGNPPPMCVYGPVFVWFARAITALTLPLGPAAPLWVLRIFSCAALAACAPLAYAAFAPFTRSRRLLAAAGIALNPLAIWSCAEGHNDVLVVAAVLAGFVLVARSRIVAGAVTIALASLVKAPALLAAAAFVVHSRHDRHLRGRVVLGCAAGAIISFAIAAPLEYGVRTHLAPGGQYVPQFSIQYALATVMPVTAAAIVTFAGCGVVAWLGLRELYRGNAAGALALAIAAFSAVPNPYPWYALWILPAAFLAPPYATEGMWAIIAASLLIVVRYYGDSTTDLSTGLSVAIVAAQFGLPAILFTGARMYRVRRGRREIRTTVPDFVTSRNL